MQYYRLQQLYELFACNALNPVRRINVHTQNCIIFDTVNPIRKTLTIKNPSIYLNAMLLEECLEGGRKLNDFLPVNDYYLSSNVRQILNYISLIRRFISWADGKLVSSLLFFPSTLELFRSQGEGKLLIAQLRFI